MSRRVRALVVGGGIGGLSAAIALARRDIAVVVLEKAPEYGDVGSGVILQRNGLAALDVICERLGKRVRDAGYQSAPNEDRCITSPTGMVIAREPLLQPGETQVSVLPILRSRLLAALSESASEYSIEIRHHTAVVDWSPTDGSIGVTTGERFAADLCIAADGLRSRVRAAMVGDGDPRYLGYTSLRGRTQVGPDLLKHTVVNGRGIQLFIAPVSADMVYWTAKVTAPQGKWLRLGSSTAHGVLLEMISDWHPRYQQLVAGASRTDLIVSDICDRPPLMTWVHGTTALLGDAAHPMSPALGQGANSALEDAAVLGLAVHSTSDIGLALERYQRARVDRAAAIVTRARAQGNLDQGASRFTQFMRDTSMRLLGRKDRGSDDTLSWSPPTFPEYHPTTETFAS